MAHYIDKDALVAEIERLISNGQTKLKESEECNDYENYVALAERIATCINVLSFLDTLEVKEMDLEKEINKYISDNFFGSETMGFFANRTNEEPNDQDIALCAKHFFELGLSEEAYYEGYQQAEKDNELTWRDIEQISDIINNLVDENSNADDFGIPTNKEFYKEVLKLFNKERKEK